MTDKTIHSTMEPFIEEFLSNLMTKYLYPLYSYVENHPQLIKTVPGFLLNIERLVVYVGRTHIAVEYIGPEFIEELNPKYEFEIQTYDYSIGNCNILEEIIGFKYDSTVDLVMPLELISESLLFPTNRGLDKLTELGWNFAAQNSIMGINTPCPVPLEGKFSRVVNGMFFDADESGLKTRRIKWLDFFPICFNSSDKDVDHVKFNFGIMKKLVKPDAHYNYPMPDDFKFVQLPKLNKFIEKWGSKDSSEPEITTFLSEPENDFILSMKFGASKVYSELTCEWQSEDKKDIRPDFFVVQPNGYADIVEFKLPDISKNSVVGGNNRETFAAWLSSYISQTRVYSSYFDDPNNRKWFEVKYGFKVHKPKRWLVVGRRHNFASAIWREIMHDYNDLEIITFDDLVDGVVVQFYK